MFRLYDKFLRFRMPGGLPRDQRFDLAVLRFVVAMGVAVALTYFSRRYYEEWFLKQKSRFAPKAS